MENTKKINVKAGNHIVRNLVSAVMIQAVEDYQRNSKLLAGHESGEAPLKSAKLRNVTRQMADIHSFFNSGICEAMGFSKYLILDNINEIVFPNLTDEEEVCREFA